MAEGLVPRQRGDDVEVYMRFRRSAFEALTSDGLPVNGTMQLVRDEDAFALCLWSREVPDWPDPVPANETAAMEREVRGG